MTLLTEHFSLEEMIATSHRDIDNAPPDDVIAKLQYTASGLEHVRQILGCPVLVSSGYRCPALNCVVGGAMTEESLIELRDTRPPIEILDAVSRRLLGGQVQDEDSQHMKGEAADFISPACGHPFEICRALEASDLRFDQLIYEGTWVHVSFVDYRRWRRSVLTWRKGQGYLNGLVQ